MKELILIRHSKSDWSDTSLDDFSRPLNKRGLKDAPFMAKILKESLNKKADLIISSPSLRTRLTLNYFLEELDYKGEIIFEQSIYEAPYENLLKVLKSIPDKYQNVFLVAHNPSLNDLSSYLLKNFDQNIPTSGILKINFSVSKWKDISKSSSNLVFFKYPKMFR